MRPGVVAAATGVALFLAALAAAVVRPHDARLPSLLALGALAALAAFAFLERALLRRLLAGRQARLGSASVAYSAAVLAALAALGFLADRHALRLDLTRERRHSLGPETLEVLARVPADAKLELFGVGLATDEAAQAESRDLERRLELFARAAPSLAARSVNAQLEPALVRELGLARLPAVAVRLTPPGEAPRLRVTEAVDELSIARTIDDALLGTLPLVHVIAGHGELSVTDAGPAGGLFFAQDLRATNHDVRELVLGPGGVPAESAVVVLAGPQADLLDAELAALREHAARGGRFLVLLAPPPAGEGAPVPTRLAAWLSEDWGLDLPAEIAADLDSIASAGDPTVLVVAPARQRTHPITRDHAKITVLPVCRPVLARPLLPVGVAAETLLRSGPQSWGETVLGAGPAYDPSLDRQGPIPLAAALTRQPHPQEKEARLVVIGSPYVAANATYRQAGNADFLRNSMDWLAGREQALAQRRGKGKDGTTVIPAQQGRVIMLTSALVPLVVLAAGLATWWHRRRL